MILRFSYPLSKLNEKSKKRVEKNPLFKKITDSVNWYKERKEKTHKVLSLDAYLKEKKLIKEQSEKFEVKDGDPNVIVESAKKLKKKEDKERFKEFSEQLQKDPYIGETLAILGDITS